MQLYRYKPLNLGFVVLCQDGNTKAARITVNSIRRRYTGPVVVAVSGEISKDAFAEINAVCPTYHGGKTVMSLLNAGMDNATGEWNVTVMAGSLVRDNIDKKYSYFIEDESDVLYAIVEGRYEFPDCSLSGIMVHKKAWETIGHFCPYSPLPVCKLLWAQEAFAKGSRLKGVIGVRMV